MLTPLVIVTPRFPPNLRLPDAASSPVACGKHDGIRHAYLPFVASMEAATPVRSRITLQERISPMRIPWSSAMLISLAALIVGCGGNPVAVRGQQVDGLDQEAFGTGLDKHDLQTLMHENMKAFDGSAALRRWRTEGRPSVAVVPMRNETSEHIDGVLEALVSEVETLLIEKGEVRVVSLERQPQIMDEIRRQHGGGYDPANVARWGKQVGARYFVTGKVFSADERFGDERRVQYFMFMQIVDVETGDILFQNKSQITKAILQE
jgi:uncharacterized protein (TIGR02722 family)